MALQQLLELLDPVITLFVTNPLRKKLVTSITSGLAGWALAGLADLRVLGAMNYPVHAYLDIFVTALVVSAGTEGFNSILKFVFYKKEETKGDAVTAKANAGGDAPTVNRGDNAASAFPLRFPAAPVRPV
ncbi:MAG TPA: hypothetical protein VEK11_04590 [Thermoanaerobaculia bacterium]|nr:hypothetical protein [Thermoanaerobaculia bacterium]